MKGNFLKKLSFGLMLFLIVPMKINAIESKKSIVDEYEFDNNNLSGFNAADGWANGFGFDCIWRMDNVTFKDGIMSLRIDKDKGNSSYEHSGAGVMTDKYYKYGYYATKMRSIKNVGVVSSFFTYAETPKQEAHEIDIEFLGNDSRMVQFNYFVNGIGEHEFDYRLDYDASEEFHEYSFLWEPDSITWFVDGKEAHRVVGNMPSMSAQIMMNVWPSTHLVDWIGIYDGTIPLNAEYDWVRYTDKLEDEDVNLDVCVDSKDLALVASHYNEISEVGKVMPRYDINKDGIVDIYDLVKIAVRCD